MKHQPTLEQLKMQLDADYLFRNATARQIGFYDFQRN
jgi:hypothetical protein